jgi:hypothetical protein
MKTMLCCCLLVCVSFAYAGTEDAKLPPPGERSECHGKNMPYWCVFPSRNESASAVGNGFGFVIARQNASIRWSFCGQNQSARKDRRDSEGDKPNLQAAMSAME